MGRRLSVCYAVPGHYFLPEVGPTLNVMSVAEALSEVVDVTLAFRKVTAQARTAPYRIIELDPDNGVPPTFVDDSAVRGTKLSDFFRYLLALRKFAERNSDRFDVVLEKSWLFSGYLTSAFQKRGVPGALVENLVRIYDQPFRDLKNIRNYFRYYLSQTIVRHYARKVPVIIVETDELKSAMTQLWGIADERIEVVELGVDTRLFHPRDQCSVRRALGMDTSMTVLTYVGVLDQCHNLRPAIEALNQLCPPNLQLHVVGDGILRTSLEQLARRGKAAIYFHGRVPHSTVPRLIAAADLCLAPYEPPAFFNGKVSFSTLKTLEYMACARPVVSVPSGHILSLVEDGLTGFLFPNETARWRHFLGCCPPRSRLREMGLAAARTLTGRSWEATAQRYLEVCNRITNGSF